MAGTTLLRIRSTASHLAAVSDDTLNLLMEDAALEVSKLNVPEEYQEKLIRYLTVHLASVERKTVVKEKLEGLEKQYAANGDVKGLASTVYGAEYQRILDDLGLPSKKAKINLLVL